MSITPKPVIASLAALYAAVPAYQEAANFYNGTVGEVFSSRKLRHLLGDFGSHFRVNYARTPVDALVERTLVQGIQGANRREPIEQAWIDNELGIEAKDIHRRAYEYGDAYLIGWPDEELDSGVSLYAHDPHHVRVFYDPSRPRRKSHAVHEWTERGSEDNELGDGLWWRVNLYYPDVVEQYVSMTPLDETTRGFLGTPLFSGDLAKDPRLIPYGPEPVVENPTPGIIPVFHFRTARPYGRPEHADAYGPQNMLNKLNVTMMASVDYAGFPQRYVATDSALDPSAPVDGFAPVPLPTDYNARSTILDEGSSMEAGPGNTWLLSGANISVGQFQTAETQNFLNAIHSIIRQMALITDTPLSRFDTAGQHPSGDSLRAAEIPFNKKLEDRQGQFGVTWHEVFQYVAAVNGAGDTDAMVAWAPPGVELDKESWETALLQQQAGVRDDTVFRERGYTEEQAIKFAATSAAPVTTAPTQV